MWLSALAAMRCEMDPGPGPITAVCWPGLALLFRNSTAPDTCHPATPSLNVGLVVILDESSEAEADTTKAMQAMAATSQTHSSLCAARQFARV